MKELKNARIWSNNILKEVCKNLKGSVINVSGELDSDKEGGHYKDYFLEADSYVVSNYVECGYNGEIILDLEEELPTSLINKYDVVFNHTVLEHVFDIRQAFKNLCLLAKEVVIVVVPFVQEVHYKKEVYYDYWRPTPFAIEKMFKENEFEMIFCKYNNMVDTNTYLVCVGVRSNLTKEYENIIKKLENNYDAGNWVNRYGNEWVRGQRNKKIVKYIIGNILK